MNNGGHDQLEHVWAARDERVHQDLFQTAGLPLARLTPELFLDQFGQDFEPQWLRHGVFECPPTSYRDSWLYVSTGLSNARDFTAHRGSDRSGLGMELVLQTRRRARWALSALQHVVALQMLLAKGRFPGEPPMHVYDHVPLMEPLGYGNSQLTALFLGPLDGYPEVVSMPTGAVELLAVVGVSAGEAIHAQHAGGESLVDLLRMLAGYPLTEPSRPSLISAGE